MATPVLWPAGLASGINAFAAAMSVAAVVGIYRFELDILWVVLGGGLIGALRLLLA